MAQAVLSPEPAETVRVQRAARPGWWATARDFVTSYPYLIPVLFFFIGWQLWPIGTSLYLSFTDERFLDNQPANWVGLQNYRDLINDGLFWSGIKRALMFTAIFVPGMIFIPMVAAILVVGGVAGTALIGLGLLAAVQALPSRQ